jgi:hypothetical protein
MFRFKKPSKTAATPMVITWTSNEPTASYAYTVAQGDIITSTETGICIQTHNTQITAMLLEIADLKSILQEGN